MTYEEKQELRWVAERLIKESVEELEMVAVVHARGCNPKTAFDSVETCISMLQRAQDKLEALMGADDE